MSELYRLVLIGLGFFFVGLGIIGAFLPVLPTTPFLLLAAACFARSSKKFYNWLLNHKIFGSYIRNYREQKGITLRGKILSLTIMWLVMGYTAFFAISNIFISIIIILIGLGVTKHILSLKTIK
ncbi:MAG: YbaN family protein [Candidatus Kryptonium sp.]